MNQDAHFTHAHMVRFERHLQAPPDKVWSVLTEAKSVPNWYGNGVIEPHVGGAVELMGGHIRGTVTQWQPLRKLAYSWNVFGPGQDMSAYPESYLTLTLAPEGSGTMLTLEHLPVLAAFVKANAMGWHSFLDMVDATARGAPVESREVCMKRNAERYGVDLGKLPR
jgi:uncharacterized protein YndB with AHSA1/START domain